MLKRLTHTGSTLRARSVAEKAAIARALEDEVWPLLAEGRCRPVIDATFPLAEVRQAHALMEAGEHIGKIVLDPLSGRRRCRRRLQRAASGPIFRAVSLTS